MFANQLPPDLEIKPQAPRPQKPPVRKGEVRTPEVPDVAAKKKPEKEQGTLLPTISLCDYQADQGVVRRALGLTE